ncbi:hypothetical protein Aoki45_09730 [Algoriphagus sp. oki45]|uniref:hypothetical protein n=1 Tax=Algoriphagus sp. oki45 TaxID=3067294 RepID=UPI0027FBA2E1|nr:hypothetical protein Aoki45_09730 [Algoriphagus sp. oki45]
MLYQSLLILHIISGFLALLTGAMAMSSAKGQKNHLKSGKWYVYMMYVVGLSAILMTGLKSNPFLFTVGVFTLYLTYTGQRSIFYFRLKENYTTGWKDILPISIALIVSAGMVIQPIKTMLDEGAFYVSVMGVFGLILLISALRDLSKILHSRIFLPNDKTWLIKHIGMIGGAYIATLTAFLVTNVTINPGWVVWLTPTLVGSILISKASRDWRKKLKIHS